MANNGSKTTATNANTTATGTTTAGTTGMTGTTGTAGTTSTTHGLTVSGTGFDAHNGQTLHAVLLQNGTPKVSASTSIFAGEFAVRWWNVLIAGDTYSVAYYVDVQNTGKCAPPPTDPVWVVSLPAVTADENITVTSNANYVNACADFNSTAAAGGTTTGGTTGGTVTGTGTFTITLVGSNFNEANNKTVTASLINNTTKKPVTTETGKVMNNSFTIVFPNAATAGQAYTIDYYIDNSGNGFCNAPPVDHSWMVPVPAVTSNTVVDVTGSEDYMGVCGAFGIFDLSVIGQQFGSWQGDNVLVELLDASDNSPVFGPMGVSVDSSGNFNADLGSTLVAGHSYVVNYFVDANASGSCQSSDPADQGIVPPVNSDSQMTMQQAGTAANVCSDMPGSSQSQWPAFGFFP